MIIADKNDDPDSGDGLPPLPSQEQCWRDPWQTHRGRWHRWQLLGRALYLQLQPTLGLLLETVTVKKTIFSYVERYSTCTSTTKILIIIIVGE